jgi:NADPH:quinone reductase-like Zn-dependent oxidoreductase
LCGAIDAVSGPLAGTIFNVLPERAAFLLYGGLSNMPASGFDNLKVIFNKNQIKGFNLPEWFEQKRQTGEFDALSQFLQQLFIRGTLKTEIRKKVKLEDTVKGIREYIGEMSGGKILLQP